eukprot:10653080-Ditylum_brightwellii.AAC.1
MNKRMNKKEEIAKEEEKGEEQEIEDDNDYDNKLIGQDIKEDGNEVWIKRLSLQTFYPDMGI